MAKEILFDPPKPDHRAALLKRLAEAPETHVEALLDLMDIAQLLRDKGLLELVKGALGSGEKILEVLTETIQTNEALAMIRNVTIITKVLGGMNPAVLEEVEANLVREVNSTRASKPPGLFAIMRTFTSEDSRRFLHTVATTSQAFGKHLGIADVSGRKRKKVGKHQA